MKNLKVSHRMYLGFTASNLRVGGSFESMLSNPPGVGPSGAAEIGEREVDFFFQHGVCVDSESQRGIVSRQTISVRRTILLRDGFQV